MSLRKYNEKRKFEKTPEPKGKKQKNKVENRFVVQFHKARNDHFDFRLEHNGELLSFAIPKEIPQNVGEKRLAVMVEPHPIEYINFSGVIPEGNYGAGSVEIFDSGKYTPKFDMDYGLKKGHIRFILNGEKLIGEWSLIKTDDKNWIMLKHKTSNINSKESQKVISPKAKTKLPFKKISPMLCTLSSEIPTGKDWAFEIKYDGYRIITFCENGKAKCFTRNGIDYTAKLKPIASALEKLDFSSFILDGEVVSFDKSGRSDFGLLLQNLKTGKNLYYEVFDILAFRGESLLEKPLIERKDILKITLAKADKNILFSEYVLGYGKKCFSTAKKLGLEGIVAKKVDSLYEEKRSTNWLKIKCYKSQEFIILGYTKTNKNPTLSALILGYYTKDNKLKFIGKVGTGFDEKNKVELRKKLDRLKQIKNSKIALPTTLAKQAILVEPKLVCNIQYAEILKSGVLRQPSFLGLREDKKAKDVVLEEV